MSSVLLRKVCKNIKKLNTNIDKPKGKSVKTPFLLSSLLWRFSLNPLKRFKISTNKNTNSEKCMNKKNRAPENFSV